MMELNIVFAGKDTLRFLESKEDKIESQQNLWLDRINMKVGDKNIADCPILSSPDIVLSQKNVVHSDSLLNSDFDYAFKNKKIVAFGESVHGSATIIISINRQSVRIENFFILANINGTAFGKNALCESFRTGR